MNSFSIAEALSLFSLSRRSTVRLIKTFLSVLLGFRLDFRIRWCQLDRNEYFTFAFNRFVFRLITISSWNFFVTFPDWGRSLAALEWAVAWRQSNCLSYDASKSADRLRCSSELQQLKWSRKCSRTSDWSCRRYGDLEWGRPRESSPWLASNRLESSQWLLRLSSPFSFHLCWTIHSAPRDLCLIAMQTTSFAVASTTDEC